MKKKIFQFILIFANAFSLKAQLNADFSPSGSVTICFGQPVQFTDLSTGNPTSWKWYFGDGDSSVLQNPVHTYLFTSTYNITLIVSDGVNFDTVLKNVSVGIFPPISVYAAGSTTICQGSAVDLSAVATGGDGGPFTFVWKGNLGNFIDNSDSITIIPSGSYPDSTIYYVIANDGCSFPDTDTVVITFYPNPVADFVADVSFGCEPMTVTFTNTSISSSGIASCVWDLGGSIISSCGTISHTFFAGSYDIQLTVISNDGNNCIDQEIKTNFILIAPKPTADFSASPQPQIVGEPVSFTDLSDEVNLFWWFGDGDTSYSQNPVHIYNDTGTFNVGQIARNQYGCIDTLVKTVQIIEDTTFFVPQIMTPNGDGYNDYFVIEGRNKCNLIIYNSYNEEVYSSTDYQNNWSGTNKKGKPLDTGAYYYILKCEEGEQTIKVINILR